MAKLSPTVLVTGGAGFIGSHLVDALVRRGKGVRVVDDLSEGRLENLAGVRDRIEFIRGDICDSKVLRKALRGIRLIFHQGALRSVPKSVGNPLRYHEVNVTATLQIFLLAKETGVRRVVYATSSSVYGDDAPLPEHEGLLCRPQSPYAASKLAMEVYGGMITRLHGLETVGLRYFNVFGPRQSLENQYAVVVPKFITAILKGEPLPVYGDGRQTRDFTYVENVVQANLRAAAARGVGAEVFNVAAGQRHSVLELARTLGQILKLPAVPKFLPKRPGDVLHTEAEITRAKKKLGFRPSVSFREGLRRTALWFDQNRWAWDKSKKRHP